MVHPVPKATQKMEMLALITTEMALGMTMSYENDF